jgi:outer membrane protein OmpA-like peptidoglycan-associated protein
MSVSFPRAVRALAVAALAAFSGLAAAPRPAQAQIVPRSLEVDVFGGWYFFAGNLENFKNAPIFGGRVGINFLEYVAFEATLGYVPTSTVHGGRVAHYLDPHFDLVVHVTPWRVVPYFAVGAGFQYWKISQRYKKGVEPGGTTLLRDPYLTPEEEALGHLSYTDKDFDFIFDAGGGIKFLIFERGGFRIDGRYVLSLGQGGPDDGVPAWEGPDENQTDVWNDTFHHVEFTGSFFFLLGGGPGKDTDGDGLPDRQDSCPNDPEDKDGYLDDDGCPDRDDDGDGVQDGDDQCPRDAEDRDGWRDGDGCPDPDNDGDGLRDAEDACPDKAEDMDGYQDADGCPDPDNDQDGIPDERDKCPMEAEDKDGFRDDDGCPEPDNDGDGIPDGIDKCPDAPEEFNGIEDGDGCPEQDSDGDGVYDGRDRCPAEAEDLDGFQDQDGCPDLDNDADGILDKVDLCPMAAEDTDGWEDGDGCPDPDNDDDGIPDEKDRCPDKAEDDDGWDDQDGCPEFDNDQDGILDGADKCPNHPEKINGFEDGDGCPDEIPEELKKFTGAIPDIQFKLDSDVLLSSSYPTLNQAAQVLNQYASVRLEIQGHASSEGEHQYNLELSQRRAESVRRYLIGRGVDPARLTAVGYGETVPVDTNKTEEGRTRNRRVEFHIVQP